MSVCIQALLDFSRSAAQFLVPTPATMPQIGPVSASRESPLLHDDAASVVARVLEEEWLLPKLQVIVAVHVAEYRMLEFFVLLSVLSFSLLILCSWRPKQRRPIVTGDHCSSRPSSKSKH